MNDKTVVYSTYYNPIEGNIVRARLEDSGFACFLADENVATLNPLYNQAIGGVKLIVFERDIEAINALLAEEHNLEFDQIHEDKSAPDPEGICCENCGSYEVGYGMATKRKHSWWSAAFAFLTATYPIHAKKCYHCYHCGHEFQ